MAVERQVAASALFLKYSAQSVFNPYGMSGDNAENLLLELAQSSVDMAEGKEAARRLLAMR